MAGAGGNAIGNNRLICCDVVRGHVLDRDLLLASASVVVEPFRQHHDRACRLVGKLQIAPGNTQVAVPITEAEAKSRLPLST